ncbi:MAG: sulfotransferase domain-containing protein [Fibrobacterota bacterium]
MSRLSLFSKRPLPDFVIAGVAKGATTALKENLRRERGVYIPKYEINYFNEKYDRGEDWYRRRFRKNRLNGDKTPAYLFFTGCHERMHTLLPDAKIVILLRDPVKRAFSNWVMRMNKKKIPPHIAYDTHDFDALVDYCLDGSPTEDELYSSPCDVIHRGCYIDQLESLLQYYPRTQVYIGITEHLSSDPAGIYSEICRFIGIPPHDQGRFSFRSARVGKYKKRYLSDYARKRLSEFYEPFTARLEEYLGISLQDTWIR